MYQQITVAVLALAATTAAPTFADTRIAAKPGLWSSEVSMQGPDGSTTVVRDGRIFVNGKDMTPKELSAADIAELAADARDCLTSSSIPTVEQFVADFQRQGDDEQASWSSAEIVEATPTKIAFTGQFTSRFMAEKPYTGDTRCDVKIGGELIDAVCKITWRTPPHAGKLSTLTSKSKRIAPICTPKPADEPDSDAEGSEPAEQAGEPTEHALE
jgi:hypothetical protein